MSADTDSGSRHDQAATAFVQRARERSASSIESIYVFGSTARGEADGLSSDVDVLVVLSDDADPGIEDTLRDLAYDVMLEYGPVVEVHVLSAAAFERKHSDSHPFIQRVVSEGVQYE